MSELCGWTLRVMGIVGSRLERQSSRATPPPPFPLGIWMRRLLSQTAVEKPRASTEIGGGGFRSGSVTRRERGAQGGHLLVLESRASHNAQSRILSLSPWNLSEAIAFGGQHECCGGFRTTTGSCAPSVGLHSALHCPLFVS